MARVQSTFILPDRPLERKTASYAFRVRVGDHERSNVRSVGSVRDSFEAGSRLCGYCADDDGEDQQCLG